MLQPPIIGITRHFSRCLRQVDILSQNYNICARVAGGSNAGHTIVVGDKTFKFHLLPSGMLHPGTTGVIGNGVVVHIPTLIREMKVGACFGGGVVGADADSGDRGAGAVVFEGEGRGARQGGQLVLR